MIHFLLDRRADIDAVDHNGVTPLHLAAIMGDEYVEAVRMLLEHGANPNTKDAINGQTPLHSATRRVAQRPWRHSCRNRKP